MAGCGTLWYLVKKLQFDRTNNTQGRQYKSYSHMVVVTTLEKAAWVVALSGIVIGAVLLL